MSSSSSSSTSSSSTAAVEAAAVAVTVVVVVVVVEAVEGVSGSLYMVLTLQCFTMPFNSRRTEMKKVWYLERKQKNPDTKTVF